MQEEAGAAASAARCKDQEGQHSAQQDLASSFQLDMMLLDEQSWLLGDLAPAEQLLPDQPAAEELSTEEWQEILVRFDRTLPGLPQTNFLVLRKLLPPYSPCL